LAHRACPRPPRAHLQLPRGPHPSRPPLQKVMTMEIVAIPPTTPPAIGQAFELLPITAILYLRWRRSQAASAGVGASQPMQNDGAVAQSPSGTPPTMKLYVRAFNVPRRCDYVSSCAIFLYFHTPRTQMTQLRSRDTKGVYHLWTFLQVLKYVCHHTSDLEGRWQTCRPRSPMPGYIMDYPSPVDPAHLSIA
jgi:hypothetical protein